MRRKIPLLCLCLLCLSAPGCWDLEELDRRAFATTFGIDLAGQDLVQVTLQIPMPNRSMVSGHDGGGQQGKAFFTIDATADSVQAAFREMQTVTFTDLVTQQNKSIVLSEEIAGRGVGPHLDFLTRSPKAPPQALVFVAKGTEAADLLAQEPIQEVLPGAQFVTISQAIAKADRTYFISLWRFEQKLVHQSKDPYASLISFDPQRRVYVFDGLAVFRDDRLAGELDGTEAKMFGILTGLMHAGAVDVGLPDHSRLTLRNVRGKTEIKVKAKAGVPSFALRVRITGSIGELTNRQTGLKPSDYRALEAAVVRDIRPRLIAVIQKLQSLNADVINFGEQLRVQQQDTWKQIDWRKIYPTASFTLSFACHIERDGVPR